MARKPGFNLTAIPQYRVLRGNTRDPCFFAKDDYLCYLYALYRNESSARWYGVASRSASCG